MVPSGQTIIGVIPVRYGSSRFPGKPLADILGKPMFWHVYQRARKCAEIGRIVVATDDDRIYAAAQDLDVPVLMTRTDHPSGSDRVLEAADQMNVDDEAIVINIQGDEPLLNPSMLSALLRPFESGAAQVATLAQPIDPEKALNPDVVKVVCSDTGQALYFSRAAIPFDRLDRHKTRYLGHIGLYAYRRHVLQRFVALGTGRLEGIEQLEQLRLLENDIPIQVVLTDHASIGVDRPEDLQQVIAILKRRRANDFLTQR